MMLQPKQIQIERFSLFYKDISIISGASMKHASAPLQLYKTFSYQNPPVIGDKVGFQVHIEEGVYLLYILGSPSTNRGIIAIEVDDLEQGRIDWYSPIFYYNITRVIPFVIITNGMHTINFKTVGKNSASSSYFSVITKIWIK
ncbi:MAG: hypothetical protein F6K14_11665 [Symploca sp. SIO2C1]|nr:hypothetical protein [Symploca sp. SIO2C1]